MKKYIVKGIIVYIAGFILFFIMGFIYSYYREDMPVDTSYAIFDTWSYTSENYASRSIQQTSISSGTSFTVDQKYEKIAQVNYKTDDYDNDEALLMQTIGDFNALIQYEERAGLYHNRVLKLAIGVHPDFFDQMVEELKNIGVVSFLQINKTDKTSEYERLIAELNSLESTKLALMNLKQIGGSLDELINLEHTILDTQRQIQDLELTLGRFNMENEFCTIKVTLLESAFATELSIIQRIIDTVQWTFLYYSITIILILMCICGLWFLSYVVKNIKETQNPIDTNKKP